MNDVYRLSESSRRESVGEGLLWAMVSAMIPILLIVMFILVVQYLKNVLDHIGYGAVPTHEPDHGQSQPGSIEMMSIHSEMRHQTRH